MQSALALSENVSGLGRALPTRKKKPKEVKIAKDGLENIQTNKGDKKSDRSGVTVDPYAESTIEEIEK
jgi:hypothetical protein